MTSMWSGLEIARRSLLANQQAIDLTGRNVANANTRGYSRQAPSNTALPPHNVPLGPGTGQIGDGVGDVQVLRYRDEFLDRQYRQKLADYGAAETYVRVFDQIEQVWNEQGTAGLQTYLLRFQDALKGLANRPAQPDARVQVIEAARALVSRAQDMYWSMHDLRQNLDTTLAFKAQEINNIASEIALLNKQIVAQQAAGAQPNDLMDKRDLLLDQLARSAGATWTLQPDGKVNVYLNSQALVMDVAVSKIAIDRSSGLTSLTWANSNTPVSFRGGDMTALLDARDNALPNEYMAHLETLMGTLTREFNSLHASGYYPPGPLQPPGTNTGEAFFSVSYLDPPANTRADITSLAVLIEPGKVSAAANPDASQLDGGVAQQLANSLDGKFVTHPLTGLQNVSIMQFHAAVVGSLGVQAQRYFSEAAAFELQMQQADNMRQSVSGVSLDEEMTKLIEFQRSYTAAARMATTVDEMLEVLISRMGVVGR